MKDLKITIHIVDLQEYLELTDMSEEQVWEDLGIVTKQYAYATGTGSDYFDRCFANVIDGDFQGAINKATTTILENYVWYLTYKQ